MTFLRKKFSESLQGEIVDLVKSHQKLAAEPLLLAVCYDPGRDAGDIFIFEVMDGFGDNMIDPDRDLFEVEFGASTTVDMHLPAGCKVHLVLTNPKELSAALKERWRRACEVVEAVSRGDYEVLFEDADRGGELLQQLLPPEAAE